MPLPPFNQKKGKYNMTKKQLIAWMRKMGWVYGKDKIVQKFIEFPARGPLAGRISMQEFTYVPKNYTCPNVRHGKNDWIFLTLLPTGVYLTCIHRRCRITSGVPKNRATRKKRPVEITFEEARKIEAEQKQWLLSNKLLNYADTQGLFEEEYEE